MQVVSYSSPKKSNVLIGQSQATAPNGLIAQNTINTGNTNAKTLTGKFNGAQGGGSDLLSLTRGLGAYSGIFSASQVSSSFRISGTNEGGTKYGLYVDATHRHTLTGDVETRPTDFTYKIWLRTA